MKIFINGSLVPENEAHVSVLDRGFLYGDSVFETMRAYSGTPFMLDGHIERLFRSAKALHLRVPLSLDEVHTAINDTIRENSLSDAYIRVMVSRGVGAPGYDPTAETTPTFVVFAREFSPPPHSVYCEGVGLFVSTVRRNAPQALDPAIKSGNFLNNILAKGEAARAGAYEAIMLSLEGIVAECTASNIFFVRDGVLHTPSTATGILDGITRGVVIQCARLIGIEVREGEYTLDALLEADEVFLTNTTTEVMPVRAVGDRRFAVGPLAQRLRQAYQAMVCAEGKDKCLEQQNNEK